MGIENHPKAPDSEEEPKIVGPGSIFEVDSEGNAKEVPPVNLKGLLGEIDRQKEVLKPVIDHVTEVREKMKKEGK